jgi:hypothetical protein
MSLHSTDAEEITVGERIAGNPVECSTCVVDT